MDATLTIPAASLKAGASAESFVNQPVLIPGTAGTCGLVRAASQDAEGGPISLSIELGVDLEPIAPEPAEDLTDDPAAE